MYPNVVSLHLETDVAPPIGEAPSTRNFGLNFTHRVRDGATSVPNYGLEIAKVAGLPDQMLRWAQESSAKLSHLEELKRANAAGTKVAVASVSCGKASTSALTCMQVLLLRSLFEGKSFMT